MKPKPLVAPRPAPVMVISPLPPIWKRLWAGRLMPPARIRLPATEPMEESLLMLTTPVIVLVPEALESWPVFWMPPQTTLPLVARLKFCVSVMPPASWKAELTPPPMATVLLPAPRAAELAATTTPCWMVRVPSQFGLAAARTSVPMSSFVRFAVGLPVKGVLMVRVLPETTCIQALLTRLMVRLVVQVFIARKPVPPETESRIWLAGSPRAASEVAAM